MNSKINIITPIFANKLSFSIKKIWVKAQIINQLIFKIFGIVMMDFPLQNNNKKVRFFEKTFLLAIISINIVLEIFFFIFSDVYI